MVREEYLTVGMEKWVVSALSQREWTGYYMKFNKLKD